MDLTRATVSYSMLVVVVMLSRSRMPTCMALPLEVWQAFTDSTMVTIAHRLGTVMDHDLVFVLDDGCCVETGPPQKLLLHQHSTFKAMAAEAGIVAVGRSDYRCC